MKKIGPRPSRAPALSSLREFQILRGFASFSPAAPGTGAVRYRFWQYRGKVYQLTL